MSEWRRIAIEHLPEFKSLIADKDTSSPMDLWIELNLVFDELCNEEIPNLDLIQRVWKYCLWSLRHRSGDVRTAAALAFCEHLIDNKNRVSILPHLMKRNEFLSLKPMLLYHNDEERYQEYLEWIWAT